MCDIHSQEDSPGEIQSFIEFDLILNRQMNVHTVYCQLCAIWKCHVLHFDFSSVITLWKRIKTIRSSSSPAGMGTFLNIFYTWPWNCLLCRLKWVFVLHIEKCYSDAVNYVIYHYAGWTSYLPPGNQWKYQVKWQVAQWNPSDVKS